MDEFKETIDERLKTKTTNQIMWENKMLLKDELKKVDGTELTPEEITWLYHQRKIRNK